MVWEDGVKYERKDCANARKVSKEEDQVVEVLLPPPPPEYKFK